jgi:hypothetical protein
MTDADLDGAGPTPAARDTTFFDDPIIDQLLRALATLAMEVSVARERADMLERYLQAHHGMAPDALDQLVIDPDAEAARAAARVTLIADIFGPLAAHFTSR